MKTLNEFERMISENLGLLGIGKNQFEIFAEAGQVLEGGNQETETGFHYADIEYRLVLDIENLPNGSFALLCLLVKRFVDLLERNNLAAIEMDFSPHNIGQSQDVEITFGVRDALHLVEVENSPIVFNGKKWGFGEGGLDVAETLGTINKV